MKKKTFALLNLLGFIVCVAINGLANALPINGIQTGELSDLYPNLFVPAGFTFSIWGLIYLWLALLVGYGLYTAFSANGDKTQWIEKMGPWFLIQSILNASWIIAWHYQLVWISFIIMVGILLSLITLYTKLGIGEPAEERGLRFLVHPAISLYLGWIIVATVANMTALLVSEGFSGLGISEVIWTVIVLVVAAVIGILIQIQKKDLIPSLVTLWAFWGIFVKRSNADVVETEILISLGVLTALILGVALWRFILKK